ncbi:hypothetical protein GGX14DRAFT_391971 [Mycena pura]|uniref:Uncharacterized protein n=1 Tax=Mycena pura TaxID=153505 RepID=A0AAD6VKF6_9AGAR|nr:hypothetical protein GGX14DRAFT_391971 [Mycena pura]
MPVKLRHAYGLGLILLLDVLSFKSHKLATAKDVLAVRDPGISWCTGMRSRFGSELRLARVPRPIPCSAHSQSQSRSTPSVRGSSHRVPTGEGRGESESDFFTDEEPVSPVAGTLAASSTPVAPRAPIANLSASSTPAQPQPIVDASGIAFDWGDYSSSSKAIIWGTSTHSFARVVGSTIQSIYLPVRTCLYPPLGTISADIGFKCGEIKAWQTATVASVVPAMCSCTGDGEPQEAPVADMVRTSITGISMISPSKRQVRFGAGAVLVAQNFLRKTATIASVVPAMCSCTGDGEPQEAPVADMVRTSITGISIISPRASGSQTGARALVSRGKFKAIQTAIPLLFPSSAPGFGTPGNPGGGHVYTTATTSGASFNKRAYPPANLTGESDIPVAQTVRIRRTCSLYETPFDSGRGTTNAVQTRDRVLVSPSRGGFKPVRQQRSPVLFASYAAVFGTPRSRGGEHGPHFHHLHNDIINLVAQAAGSIRRRGTTCSLYETLEICGVLDCGPRLTKPVKLHHSGGLDVGVGKFGTEIKARQTATLYRGRRAPGSPGGGHGPHFHHWHIDNLAARKRQVRFGAGAVANWDLVNSFAEGKLELELWCRGNLKPLRQQRLPLFFLSSAPVFGTPGSPGGGHGPRFHHLRSIRSPCASGSCPFFPLVRVIYTTATISGASFKKRAYPPANLTLSSGPQEAAVADMVFRHLHNDIVNLVARKRQRLFGAGARSKNGLETPLRHAYGLGLILLLDVLSSKSHKLATAKDVHVLAVRDPGNSWCTGMRTRFDEAGHHRVGNFGTEIDRKLGDDDTCLLHSEGRSAGSPKLSVRSFITGMWVGDLLGNRNGLELAMGIRDISPHCHIPGIPKSAVVQPARTCRARGGQAEVVLSAVSKPE